MSIRSRRLHLLSSSALVLLCFTGVAASQTPAPETPTHQQPAGVGNARDTGPANHAGGASGGIANRTDAHCPHRHGDSATTVANAPGETGGAGQGDDTAPSHHSDAVASAERDYGRPTGCDLAIQPAGCLADDDHQQPDSGEPGPELRQPVLHAARRDIGRSCAGRIATGTAWAR